MKHNVLPIAPLRLALLIVALALAVAALLARGLGALPLMDFVEYWAAGRLNATGANPYDLALIEEVEHQGGREGDGLPMLNPPWTLALLMPFGLLPPHLAHLLWLALQVAVLVWAAQTLWDYYGGERDRRRVAWCVTFTFVPTYLALLFCQITPLPLAGAVLFLSNLRRGRDGLAGAATVLLAIKPHLVSLFWLALVVWAVRQGRWRVLVGAACALVAATAAALVCNPAVLQQYIELMAQRPPEVFRTPTLGTLLREGWGGGPFWLQYLSLVPGVLWLAAYGLHHRRDWDWGRQLPAVLLGSLLTAPYGAWPFDLVLLLVPVLRVAARADQVSQTSLSRMAVALYGAINGAAAILVAGFVNFFWFLWMTPALVVGYLVMDSRIRESASPVSSDPAVCASHSLDNLQPAAKEVGAMAQD
jgi:hypothetical protein